MKTFSNILTASINNKGVLDIDTVKGCSFGTEKYNHGCYGECYAYKLATARGFDFSKSVSRNDLRNMNYIVHTIKNHTLDWFRIGTMGDPCIDWNLTIGICSLLYKYKTPVIITKYWNPLSKVQMKWFKKYNTIINISISPLDEKNEIDTRLDAFYDIKNYGIKAILRIVSCKFGNTTKGKILNDTQDDLFKHLPVIDNPLRASKNNKLVISGDMLIEKIYDLNSYVYISKNNPETYIGYCMNCSDQCGCNLGQA